MSERKSWDIQPKKKVSPQPAQRPSAPAPSARPTSQNQRTAANSEQRRQSVQRVTSRKLLQVSKRSTKAANKSALAKQRLERVDHSEPVRATAAMRPKKVLQGKDREPLKNRRKRERNRLQLILSVFAVLAVVGLYVCVWLPAFRIQYVQAAGPDATNMQADTEKALTGTIEYVVPRNSILFFPESEIRDQLLTQYPDVLSVSISRTSFDSISIVSIPREAAFVWCGSTYPLSDAPSLTANTTDSPEDASSSDSVDSEADSNSSTSTNTAPATVQVTVPNCYDADTDGLIFAAAPSPAADVLKVYGPLVSSTSMPIGEHISRAASIPDALEFVKEIKSLSVPVTALVLRNDEADLYAQSGTRITYVLGQEKSAVALAASTFPSLNINDGSLEYVDLRFDDKVYFKKFGAESSSN
jgi:hypothetical protein